MLVWAYSMYTDKRKYGPQQITDVMEPFGRTPFSSLLLTLKAFPNPGLPFTHWSLCLRACHEVRASEAVGIGALGGVSMGNNQMYQFRDSRDLLLPACGQLDTLKSNFCPCVCAPSCLTEDWWGWILNGGTQITQEEGEILPLLTPGAKTSMWIWQHHLFKKYRSN